MTPAVLAIVLTHCSCGCIGSLSDGGLALPNCDLTISPSATLRHRVAPCPVGTQPAFASQVRCLHPRLNYQIEFTRRDTCCCSRAPLADVSQGKFVVVVCSIHTPLSSNLPMFLIGGLHHSTVIPHLSFWLVGRDGPAPSLCISP